MGADIAILPFVINATLPTNSDPYLAPQPEREKYVHPSCIPAFKGPERLPKPNKTKLFYYMNTLTNVHCLYIPSSVALNLLKITYGESHSGFSRYYEIISHSWFIRGLIKLFCSFICHCLQCLALQTKQHPLYRSFQPIESPPVPFFMLILDFVLALSL